MQEKSLTAESKRGYDVGMARKKLPPEILEYFRKEGVKGGRIGGKVAAANMTAKERSERARKAVQARERKRRAAKRAKPGG